MSGYSRSSNVRKQVAEVFKNAKKPMTRQQVCDAVGASYDHVGRILHRMVFSEEIENVTPENRKLAHYVICYKPKKEEPECQRVPRYVPPNMPSNYWRQPAPARAGADDHSKVPSLRADGRVMHMPMMLMASKVRGGESAR